MSWSINNLQKCFLIFLESGPLKFLKVANPLSRYRARFFLLYFSDNLWSKKLLTSLHTFAQSKASIAFVDRNDFQVCLIIALSSVGTSVFSSANLKAFSNRGSLIEG